jgi:DNA helicase-2/ATP-dependent DNA helicase PcrA
MTYTQELIAFLQEVETGTQNILLRSTAGSGKTTSIMESLQYISPDDTKLLCSFTNKITTTLRERVSADGIENCQVSTLNSFGWNAVKKAFGGKLNRFKTGYHLKRLVNFESEADFFKVVKTYEKFISLFKSYVIHPSEVLDRWKDLAEYHSIEYPSDTLGDSSQFANTLYEVYSDCVNDRTQFDFDDQKFVPVYYDLPLTKFDWVYVDEAQDCNVCDLQLIQKLGGRFVFVGDDEQAIYLFRGALNDALERISEMFDTKELGLTVCWRCSKSVIEEAAKISTKIKAPQHAIPGSVSWIEAGQFVEKVQRGAFCLSRTSAVAVSGCLSALKAGKPARVLGREIEQQLIKFIESMKTNDLPTLKMKIDEARAEEGSRLRELKLDDAAQRYEDTCDTVNAFIEVSKSFRDVLDRISEIFTDAIEDGILFMTIHKAKGLENDTVFFLDEGNCPHPSAKLEHAVKQEMNLRFVAVTRARKNLIYVRSKPRGKQ